MEVHVTCKCVLGLQVRLRGHHTSKERCGVTWHRWDFELGARAAPHQACMLGCMAGTPCVLFALLMCAWESNRPCKRCFLRVLLNRGKCKAPAHRLEKELSDDECFFLQFCCFLLSSSAHSGAAWVLRRTSSTEWCFCLKRETKQKKTNTTTLLFVTVGLVFWS